MNQPRTSTYSNYPSTPVLPAADNMLPNILPQINPKGDPRRVNEVNKDVPPNGDGMRVLCVFEEKTSITFVNFDEVRVFGGVWVEGLGQIY